MDDNVFLAVDTVILDCLKRGLAGLLPEDRISSAGQTGAGQSTVIVSSGDFTVDDESMKSGQAMPAYETLEETFAGDGQISKFRLSHKPIRTVTAVEYPASVPLSTPDDYVVDIDEGLILFREPARDTVRICYETGIQTGETYAVSINIEYYIDLAAGEKALRDRLISGVIRCFFMDMPRLAGSGVEDVRLIKGCAQTPGSTSGEWPYRLHYSVAATMKLFRKSPPMAGIAIKTRNIGKDKKPGKK